ncbi:MAG: YicC/YloC family endoribonuclease [Ignavibacteriaceae bacterium]
MIYSMTGYGKGSAQNENFNSEVEVKSVNSRFLEISLKLPASLMNREYEIREFIKSKINRGKLSVIIQLKNNGAKIDSLFINKEKLKSYLSLVKELKKTAKINEKVKLDHLLNHADIFSAPDLDLSDSEFYLIKKALDSALAELLKMKKNEGKELTKDLIQRIKIIESQLEKIEKDTATAASEYFIKLKERISILISDINIDNDRLQQELAIIADKADITEECVRLKSHIKFFLESLNESEPGRKLNFLCQEMNREANTISSKSISTLTIHNSVFIKEEIEKIREQIQNLE